MTILLIYLAGYIVAWVIVRKWTENDTPDWNRVGIRYMMPSLSWFFMLIWLCLEIYDGLGKLFGNKPPRWL